MSKPFQDHFSGVAAAYSRFRPHYPAALFDHLAEVSPGRALAWDCATGSGQAALALAERFSRVVATDASAEQIAHAQPHPRVEYRVAPAERSGLDPASVELVTVAQAMHWFDIPAFFREARRVLRPGGVLAAWCYGNPVMDDPVLERVVVTLYADTLGAYWPPERALIVEGYASIELPFEELPAPRMELEADLTLDGLAGYLHTWSARKRYVEEHGTDPVGPAIAQMREHWGDPDAPRRVRWPLYVRLGRAGAA